MLHEILKNFLILNRTLNFDNVFHQKPILKKTKSDSFSHFTYHIRFLQDTTQIHLRNSENFCFEFQNYNGLVRWVAILNFLH